MTRSIRRNKRNKREPVGYNPLTTPRKQEWLDRAMRDILGYGAGVARKYGVPLIAADMTAGPGLDRTGRPGSPLIIAKHLSNLIERGYHPELICVEREQDRLDQLHTLLFELHPNLPVEYFTDQAEALSSIPRNAVGPAYFDNTFYTGLDKGLLTRFGHSHRFMDILITRQCHTTNRLRGVNHPDLLTIQEYLALTGKSYSAILKYSERGWWTFGFATNAAGYKKQKLPGFYFIDDPQAKKWCSLWTPGMEVEAKPEVIKEIPLW